MTTYDLWEKAIKTKEYTKAVVIRRVTQLKKTDALTQDELTSLLALIEEVYA